MRDRVAAILFDAVGTILRPDPPVACAYATVGRRFGSALGESEVQRRFAAAFSRQERLDSQQFAGRTEHLRERQRWEQIVREVLDDIQDKPAAFAALWDHFAAPAHWKLFDDVPGAWRQLAESGTTLGVASNFDERLHAICRAQPCLADSLYANGSLPGQVFVSSEVGYRKPSREFFRHIESRLRLKPEQLMLVGDDLENDYRAARAAGWHAVLLDRSGVHAGRSGVDAPIKTLGELIHRQP